MAVLALGPASPATAEGAGEAAAQAVLAAAPETLCPEGILDPTTLAGLGIAFAGVLLMSWEHARVARRD